MSLTENSQPSLSQLLSNVNSKNFHFHNNSLKKSVDQSVLDLYDDLDNEKQEPILQSLSARTTLITGTGPSTLAGSGIGARGQEIELFVRDTHINCEETYNVNNTNIINCSFYFNITQNKFTLFRGNGNLFKNCVIIINSNLNENLKLSSSDSIESKEKMITLIESGLNCQFVDTFVKFVDNKNDHIAFNLLEYTESSNESVNTSNHGLKFLFQNVFVMSYSKMEYPSHKDVVVENCRTLVGLSEPKKQILREKTDLINPWSKYFLISSKYDSDILDISEINFHEEEILIKNMSNKSNKVIQVKYLTPKSNNHPSDSVFLTGGKDVRILTCQPKILIS